jgi:hypothetical protein
MTELFDWKGKFNDDIIKWNVSNVTDMSWIFSNIRFNDDISGWDVSNLVLLTWIHGSHVRNVRMFSSTLFTGDISGWNGMSVVLLACGACSAIPSFIGTWMECKQYIHTSTFYIYNHNDRE